MKANPVGNSTVNPNPSRPTPKPDRSSQPSPFNMRHKPTKHKDKTMDRGLDTKWPGHTSSFQNGLGYFGSTTPGGLGIK